MGVIHKGVGSSERRGCQGLRNVEQSREGLVRWRRKGRENRERDEVSSFGGSGCVSLNESRDLIDP